jgi:protein-S-isoprenylcysteine O-methyltransferase Ste14
MKRIKFWRLIWTLFVVLYAFNFFRNLFTGAIPDNRIIPVVFFTIMILWMAVEFYFEMPFFQAGIVHEPPVYKILFALFFYPFLAFCVSDFTWLGWTQIRLPIPVINYLGIVLFLGACAFRLYGLYVFKTKSGKKLWRTAPFSYSRHPRYLATVVQIVAIPFVFSSYLGIVFALVIGLPIILREVQLDDRRLTEFYKPEYDNYKTTIPLLFPIQKKR